MNAKIARLAYRRLRQTDLGPFTENVIKRTKDVTAYASVASEVTGLETILQTFTSTLAAARNRGIIEVATKNDALDSLIKQLDKMSDALELMAVDNDLLIIGAGFSIKQTFNRFSGLLEPPTVVKVASTGRKGEIRVQLTDDVPGAVVTHAIEYSLDKGASWNNGRYHGHSDFQVKGLPTSSDMLIHFMSIGRADITSEWSEPVTVAVL